MRKNSESEETELFCKKFILPFFVLTTGALDALFKITEVYFLNNLSSRHSILTSEF